MRQSVTGHPQERAGLAGLRLHPHRSRVGDGELVQSGQVAQMALAWTLRDPRVTSTLIGASSAAQLEANVGALEQLDFDADELAGIDRYATESGINLWARSSVE